MQIPTHRIVGKRIIGIGRVVSLLLPLLRSVIRLLIDIGNFVFSATAVSTLTKRRLVLCDGHLPAIEGGAVVNVVRGSIEFRCRCNHVWVAIGTAACHKVRNALVDFDFVVLNTVLRDLTLSHIGKIVAKPRPLGIRRVVLNLHEPLVGAIRLFVVIPKLLAGVFAIRRVDLFTERDLVFDLIIFNEGIHGRARLAFAVAKALEQARMSENGPVCRILARGARHVNLVERRRHLVGIFSHAKSTEERGCRRGSIRVPTG